VLSIIELSDANHPHTLLLIHQELPLLAVTVANCHIKTVAVKLATTHTQAACNQHG
jgi:hypothetical protein